MKRFFRWITNADAREQIARIEESLHPGGSVYEAVAKLQRRADAADAYERALEDIDTSAQIPKEYIEGNDSQAAMWWKHVASNRRERAQAALREVGRA